MIDGVEVRPAEGPASCPFCREALDPTAARWTCLACGAAHHVECRDEGGGRCAVCRAPAPGSPVDLRPVETAPRCPRCHAAPAKGEETWTCDACRAVHHTECLREAGGACVTCRGPARVSRAPAAAERTRAATRDPVAALGAGLLVQAAGLVLAGFVGAAAGGQNALIVAGLACVTGILTTGLRARGEEGWTFGALHALIDLPVFGLIPALIDALDVTRRKPSMTMLGICALSAALSAIAGRWFRGRA